VPTGVPDDLRSRHRLGERRHVSRPRLAFAVLVSTTLVALGSSAGAWLGWRGAPALPGTDDAGALVQGVVPGRPLTTMEAESPELSTVFPAGATGLAVLPLSGGNHFGAGYVRIILDTGRDRGVVGAAATRLRDAGWQVRAEGAGFTATAQGLGLEVHPSDGDGEPVARVEDYRRLTLTLYRAEPRAALPLALLGGLAGAALGYGWLRLRARRRGRYRTVADATALAGVLALLPASLLTVGVLGLRLVGSGAAATVTGDGAFVLVPLRPLTAAGLLVLAVALAVPAAGEAERLVRGRLAAR
jgi:hypothetical protein